MFQSMLNWFRSLDRYPVNDELEPFIFGVNTSDIRYHPNFTTDAPIGSGFEITRTSSTTSHPYSESPLDPRMNPKVGALESFAFKLALVPAPIRVWMTMNYILHEMDNY